MKKMLVFFAITMFSASLFAQEAVPAKKAEELVKFKDLTYNFGKIKQGVPVTHDFVFTNVSDKPIVIETATPSCGCTTPVWPQAPIGKGKADKITAGFNAGSAGPFTKTIAVKLAGVDGVVTITITGDVLNTEEYVKYEKAKNSKGKK